MNRLVCTLSSLFLFASASVAQEIDDSSYESLFKAAYQSEKQLSYQALDAIIQFNGLDLIPFIYQPYQKTEGEAYNARHMAASNARNIAERLFRAGRIDEGIAFLTEMLPPQAPDEGMLACGYVSESLLEQKRFDEAWQIATSGPPQEQLRNVAQYIQRTIAKNYYEKEPSGAAWIPHLPPYVPNKEDAEIYRAEANRAFEYLQKLTGQVADDQQRTFFKYVVADALAALGRSDEAYALVENEADPSNVLRTILKERRENGTQEEVDQWFQKVRKLYDGGKIRGGIDWPAATTFIWYCLDAEKYLDAMDAIESHGGRNMGTSGSPDGYFDRIPKLNVETEFRHNSKELIERMIKYHDKVAAAETLGSLGLLGWNNRFQFYPNIVKAQLNLGLVDDALASLRKITCSLEALEALGDIAFYVHKHKTPEEASRIETEAIKIFRNVYEIKRQEMGDYYLVDYYAKLAVRLMKDGEAEKGAQCLKTAFDKAEERHLQTEKEEGRRFNTHSEMGRVCASLISNGFLDEATEIVGRVEEHHVMPGTHLQLAGVWAEAGETEKAKAALRKSLDVFLQNPSLNYGEYSRMATLAGKLNDKELFYEIMNDAIKIAERRTWSRGGGGSEALGIFLRQLAVNGDKEHPLFAQAEKCADSIVDTSTATNYTGDMAWKASLYFSLGISLAMIDDHVGARRVLKKGIDTRRQVRYSQDGFCAPVIEARSYEKR